jgi:outer membrane protein insertion porin family
VLPPERMRALHPSHGQRPAGQSPPAGGRSWGLALTLAAASALGPGAAPARAADLPGTPQQSRGAPGATAGRTDPFGTEGDEALRSPSPAEEEVGSRGRVLEAIELSGNRHTDGEFIRRHLALTIGEVVTPEAIRAARVRLLQLGIFSHVDVTATPGSRPGLIALRFKLDERAPIQVTDLSLWHTAVSRLYGSIGLADPVLLGRGVGLWLAAALDDAGRRRAFELILYDPDLRVAGRSWIAGARAYFQQGLESGCATPRCEGKFSAIPWLRYRRLGFELDGGWRLGPFSRVLAAYRLEALQGASDPGVVAAARPALREDRSALSALVFGYDADSRDDPLLPTAGVRFEGRLTVSTAALGSEYEYTRYLLQLERWFGLGGGRALRLDVALGLVQGDAPFFERYYAADWSYFSVGVAAPRVLDLNFSPDSRYDVLLAVLGLECDFTLWEARGGFLRRGFLALGSRFVYSAMTAGAGRSALSATPVSVDLAFRADTRLGVITIGLGYITDQLLKLAPVNVPGVQER